MAGEAQDRLAVVVDHLHKWYRIYATPTERIKRVLGRPSRHLDFQALDGVSFTVEKGTALGVIGENGAGKSTLLKIIAGTTPATGGSVEVSGVVAAILELGAAFHPEFSGRDNAILYGALMGLEREQMEARLDDIFAFSELGEFIQHPVKSYSTGMVMRLAFAVATHVDPDVLVVDEALAVGDGYFQKKCVDRIVEIRDRGTTVLFCSHSMYYVSLFCERALWLRQGKVAQDGPAQEVVNAYEEYLVTREKRRLDAGDASGAPPSADPRGQQARIVGIRVLDDDGSAVSLYRPGMDLVVEIEWESAVPDGEFHIGISIDRGDGTRVVATATFDDGMPPLTTSGRRRDRVTLRNLPLAKGHYSVTGYVFDPSALHIWDQAVLTDCLHPESQGWTLSLLRLDHDWNFDRGGE
jgi:ABC-type polysaccharide/polyol phosphate transport system ATPase subunit